MSFHDKNTQQIGIEEIYLNVLKDLYEKPQLTSYSWAKDRLFCTSRIKVKLPVLNTFLKI